MRGQIQLHPFPTSRAKEIVHGKPTLIYISGSSNRFLAKNRHSATSFKRGTANICMRGQIQLHPSYLQRQRSVHGKPTLILSLVATAIDFATTDTLQHPLKGGTANICMRGQIQLHPSLHSRGKEVCMKPTLIYISGSNSNRFLAKTDTLQHP
ncbi:hypothetical protein CEXT_723841 [Caerostris extrusa]|uniref:Uncharacterized protein n=1 Tax=Caerostris extrusa TaxID=172846 RepID=A0AAV4M574_CAEEX|nr:hypothetical protein CEXT_723841 [Caerostris extrusa]